MMVSLGFRVKVLLTLQRDCSHLGAQQEKVHSFP